MAPPQRPLSDASGLRRHRYRCGNLYARVARDPSRIHVRLHFSWAGRNRTTPVAALASSLEAAKLGTLDDAVVVRRDDIVAIVRPRTYCGILGGQGWPRPEIQLTSRLARSRRARPIVRVGRGCRVLLGAVHLVRERFNEPERQRVSMAGRRCVGTGVPGSWTGVSPDLFSDQQ